ncbi:protein Star-like [Ostrinia furnacalis]|uniref:protein Star-like n=1 Tax=Ostrinia furnacalis TaxID=93504 RepID=UPI00103DB3C6|nr:protein Star-like [Ostrinia furnacalis]
MAEKKIQENPLPEEQSEAANKPKEPAPDKPTTVPVPIPVEPVIVRPSVPSFTKTPPNDLYRRLLPAVLFVLTFVTVMTMLLIYMDNAALGAQQFRLNMTRDYELARIPQESAALVAYVRQLHLQPRPRAPPAAPPASPRADLVTRLVGDTQNGTFVEFLPRGPRDPTTLYLESSRGWEGVVVRAAARDYLALRGGARALHACLSPTVHPREVTYQSPDSHSAMFSSRVLCLPLYTVLLAAEATHAQYALLGGDKVLPALKHVPFGDKVRLQVIEYRSSDPVLRNQTAEFLAARNYSIAAQYEDAVMFALQGDA